MDTDREFPYAWVALIFAIILGAIIPIVLAKEASASSNNNFIDNHPSCSLRAEVIPGDPDHRLYIYNGTNPSKTMWVTNGPPDHLDVFTHTFYEAGQIVGPKGAFVQYPTVNTWIPIGLLLQCSPSTEPTTTTTAQPTTTTTSTPDERVQFGCPEGQLVRFHFVKVDESVDDFVQFTYIDSFGGTRQFGVPATVNGDFVFTGSGGPSDGLTNTATLVSVDTDGFEFDGFTCYQPVPTTDEITTTTSAPGQSTTTSVNVPTTLATTGGFTPAGFTGAVAVSPSHEELPFTGSQTRDEVILAAFLLAIGAYLVFMAKRQRTTRPMGH